MKKPIDMQMSLFDLGCSVIGKTIAITGTLNTPRKDVVKALLQMGGRYGTTVTRKTDVLVVGRFRAGKDCSKKLELARKYQSEGVQISICSPGEFFSLIYATLQYDGKAPTNDCIR